MGRKTTSQKLLDAGLAVDLERKGSTLNSFGVSDILYIYCGAACFYVGLLVIPLQSPAFEASILFRPSYPSTHSDS